MPRDTPRGRQIARLLIKAEGLLEQGVSIRKTAAMCGLGRETIRRHLSTVAKRENRKGRSTPIFYDVQTDQHVRTERCEGCGAMVVPPCLRCSLLKEDAA